MKMRSHRQPAVHWFFSPRTLILSAVLACLFLAGQVQAKPFNELLSSVIKTDPRIVQARMSHEMRTNSFRSSVGEWLPAVDLSGHYGHEEIINEFSANTYFENRKFQAKLSQLLFNLSKIVGVKSAIKNREVSALSLETVKQQITLEAVSAYFNLARALQQLEYAKISENNLHKQAASEQARVQKGSGVATNVLQINQQLYGARATRVNAERAFQAAANNYKRVFKEPFTDPKELKLPQVPYGELPQTMDEFIEVVLSNNLNMRQSSLALEIAELADNSAVSPFLPEIKFIAQSQFKDDEAGTEHGKDEHVIKLDFTYNIFNGGKDYYARKNKIIGVKLAQQSLKDTSNVVEENARNYWENYISSSQRARYLHNQAKTAAEFLEKAKAERKLGRRSLIDVMNGETNYITATSTAVSADTDRALAVYNMLFLLGQLNQRIIFNFESGGAGTETTPES
jgi:adhesin transport system outer membrane protein